MPLNIQENFPMWNKLSFRAGGNTKFFAEISDFSELAEAKKFAAEKNIPMFMLGNGTNVLVSDAGYNGLIVKLSRAFANIQLQEDGDTLRIVAGAAATLGSVARKAASAGFAGIHLLAGIPGTIGGAIFMNAGAYGQEIVNGVESVSVLTASGELATRTKEECAFGYRSSAFQPGGALEGEIILGCTLVLPKGNKDVLEKEIADAMQSRREKQPLDKPNAGSAFKRPATGFPGALVEQAGLKGYRIGDAQVSEKHANFIVNLGNATATDIEKLFAFVQSEVLAKTGVQLEREVIILK